MSPIPRTLTLLAAALLAALSLAPNAASARTSADAGSVANPVRVQFETSMGAFTVELWPDEAPLTVKNFLGYVRRGFYEGLVFHRVIEGFMIQTGGYTADLEYREPVGRVPNESVGGPRNLRGTLAMARQRNPDSADSQFFINLADNRHLDADGSYPGYTVFGRVVKGMDVVERIAHVPTNTQDGFQDVPVKPVVIEHVTRIDAGAATGGGKGAEG